MHIFGAILVILAQIQYKLSRGQAKYGQNDLEDQGQWPWVIFYQPRACRVSQGACCKFSDSSSNLPKDDELSYGPRPLRVTLLRAPWWQNEISIESDSIWIAMEKIFREINGPQHDLITVTHK